MAQLPSGTVTFLFTDIEGSTRLVQSLGDAYTEVFADHQRLLRAAFEQAGGHEFGTAGDAFFVAFKRAKDAIVAAAAAQQALAKYSWPGDRLRVRIGIHTGEPTVTADDYVGEDVHRVARICSAAHGGQVLVSQATRDLLGDRVEGAAFRDLGEHRLKDLAQAQRLFELVIPDLPSDFPPPRTLDASRHNLPVELTSFVGREREIAEVESLLVGTRLLTLTGVGGAGKTRLSQHVAAGLVESFQDGVWLVALAPLSDEALVPQAVAAAFGLREDPPRSLVETLADYLAAKTLLILLDNCEHLVEATARLAESLLRAAPGVRILATSREPLRIAGETVWSVPPLSLPKEDEEVTSASPSRTEAVLLFVNRATAAEPRFGLRAENASAVAELCRRLDGIPLALELAAARVATLSVQQIAERLDDRFRLLTGGDRSALPHHQTLSSTIDWSYQLLEEPERICLQRLSVFAGGFTLEAAEAVCSGGDIDTRDVLDLLARLVLKSLVIAESGDDSARYRLLETIRQYALDRLIDSRETEAVRHRHCKFLLGLAESAPQWSGAGEEVWTQRMEADNDNLRAALEWSEYAQTAHEAHLRLVASAWRFWEVCGYHTEGRGWLDRAVAASTEAVAPLRAKLLMGAGALAGWLSDFPQALRCHEQSLALYRELGDEANVALSLSYLGVPAGAQGDYREATRLFEESLLHARAAGDKALIACQLVDLANMALVGRNVSGARAMEEEGLALAREAGSKWILAFALETLARTAALQGDYDVARRAVEEGSAVAQELADPQTRADVLFAAGNLAYLEGDLSAAGTHYDEAIALRRERGARQRLARELLSRSLVALRQGDLEAAVALPDEAIELAREVGDKGGVVLCLAGLGAAAAATGDPERAARLLGAAKALGDLIGGLLHPVDEREYEEWVSKVRTELGEERFADLWVDGQNAAIHPAVDDGDGILRRRSPLESRAR
jgi:predicted ATPase/class 3 adenylate cyclase